MKRTGMYLLIGIGLIASSLFARLATQVRAGSSYAEGFCVYDAIMATALGVPGDCAGVSSICQMQNIDVRDTNGIYVHNWTKIAAIGFRRVTAP